MTDIDLSDHRPVPEPTDPGEIGASFCHADGQDWPCAAVRATWPSATTTETERTPVDPAPHPTWPDGTPMLLGQVVAFAGSEVDEDVETIEARIVKIDVGEITAWWNEPDGVCEAVLEPDRFERIDEPDGHLQEPRSTPAWTISFHVDDESHRLLSDAAGWNGDGVHDGNLWSFARDAAIAAAAAASSPTEPQPDIGWIYDEADERLLHPSGFNLSAHSIGSAKPFDDLVRAVLAWPDPS